VNTKFDKRKIYEDEIAEVVMELKLLCNKYKLPMFVSVCVKNGKETEYVSDMVGSASNDIFLQDDKIPKYVNILNGFDTVPPNEILEIEMDLP